MKMQSKFLQSIFFRLEEILFVVIIFFAYKLGPQMLSLDSDLGRHIAIGNYILSTNSIPDINILSYTKPNESRPPYEWGSQVLIAITNKFMGLDGVILLFAFIIAITFTITYLNSVKYSQLPISSFLLTIIGLSASSIHWLPRPHIFTFLFLLIWINLLEKIRSSKESALFLFPLTMLVWTNFHAGFIFGLLAWFAYFIGAIWEKITVQGSETNLHKILKIGFYSFLASIITPDGWGNWEALLGNDSSYILRNTQETSSPNFFLPEMWPFLLLLMITIIVLSITEKKVHAGQIFLIAGMATLGLYMSRNIPLFAIIAIPILSQGMQGIIGHFKLWGDLEENILTMQRQVIKGLWITIFILVFVTNIIIQKSTNKETINQFNNTIFPISAINWLKENPQKGNMFNEFNWGGYLEMTLSPQLVFIDSQTDFYGETLVREYQQVISADQNWDEVITKYEIQWLLIGKTSPLAIELNTNSSEWKLLYSDNVASIFRIK